MIFVRYTPAKETNSQWPVVSSLQEHRANYWSPAELRALNADVVKATPHLEEMLRQLPEGEPLAPHSVHAKYQAKERVLGADLQASQRLTQKGNRTLDRMRSRLMTEYLITDESGAPAKVDLTVYVDTFADAAQAFGYQGSFGRAQCSACVQLPDGTTKDIKSKSESRVRPAEAEGAGGGGQAFGTGGEMSVTAPNMNPDGPVDDPQTETFSFEITSFPARIVIRSNYRLTVANFLNFNLVLARAQVDHDLTITQGTISYAKPFTAYSLQREPDVYGGAMTTGTMTNAPTGSTPPTDYGKAGDHPGRDTPKQGTFPTPGSYRLARAEQSLSPREEEALAALDADAGEVSRSLAKKIRTGALPIELGIELLEG